MSPFEPEDGNRHALDESGGGGYSTRVLLLTVLVALFAVAVLTLAAARAETPDDLRIEVSLLNDSDGIVQPGSTIEVQAELKFTGAEGVGALAVSDLALRIAGGFEWDASGRRAMPGQSKSYLTREYLGHTGEAVAVQSAGGTLTSGIQVVGAPHATVNGISSGGAVHVWENGSFVQRLTGEPTDNVSGTQFWERYNGGFGSSVDVGGSVIVVGAPYEDGAPLAGGFRSQSNFIHGFGAVYVFERNDDGEWERTAKLTVGENPAFTAPALPTSALLAPYEFGQHVAISDDGGTIVVSQRSAPQTGENHNWGASAHVFVKPATGWTDMDTNHANVTSLRYDSNGAATDDADVVAARWDAFGDVDIAGDGSVVVVGASELPRTSTSGFSHLEATGAVLVFNRPGSAWTAGSDRLLEQNAALTATDNNNVRVGSDVAISQSGGVIVSNGASHINYVDDDARDPVSGWPGSAFVWVRSTSWADATAATATLSDSTASNGDQFGRSVAISDSGDRVVVGQDPRGGPNGYGAISVFDNPGSWANDSAADTVLGSWPWARASSLSLDGESTLLAGVTGVGGYVLDLSLSDPESGLRGPVSGLTGHLTEDCSASSSDDIVTQTCTLWFEPGDGTLTTIPALTIPAGTPDGSFTLSASAMVNGVRYTDAIEVAVRDVDEVAEVTLDFATDPVINYVDTSDDKPYPSSIAAGETTRLRLSVLNENGEAAGVDAEDGIASILFTTTAGNFSNGNLAPVWLIERFSPLGYWPANCEGGNEQQTCAVPLGNVNARSADRIVIALAHPGADKTGTAEVRATVITNDGEVFNPPPVTVTFTGAAESLVVSEPTASVLNVDAPPDVGAGADDRDVLTLSVTAADKNGTQVDLPPGSAIRVTVRDPDGVVVPASRYGSWSWAYDQQQERTSLEFKLHVNASEEEALATGEYTLELRIGTLEAERTFRVGGAPASLALGEPEGALVRDERVTITATVADGDGNAVPDGTAVAWSALSVRGTDVVLVQLSADRETKAGSASATYLVIGPGAAVVTARSGDVSDVALLTIVEASVGVGEADGPPAPLSESLSSTRPGFSIWLGEQPVLASELLESLSGIESILLWENGSWLRYGLAEGRVIPGSFDFTVMRGGVLLLGR